jgi:hypothetical protein
VAQKAADEIETQEKREKFKVIKEKERRAIPLPLDDDCFVGP